LWMTQWNKVPFTRKSKIYSRNAITNKLRLPLYFPKELRAILRSEGFVIFEERGSLNKEVPIDGDSDEMVFFCRPSNR